jgi:GNAT superfamily N-acetyltransferase
MNHYSLNELFVAYVDHEAAGTIILQEEDPLFWSEVTDKDALYLHKLAIRREYAKKGLSREMLEWAQLRAQSLQKAYLRLDCAADRSKLCRFYESHGFKKLRVKLMFNKFPSAFYELKIK